MGISHSFWIFFVIFARDPKTYALGPILVIFEVCHFVMIPKLESLSTYQKKDHLRKIKVLMMKEQCIISPKAQYKDVYRKIIEIPQ